MLPGFIITLILILIGIGCLAAAYFFYHQETAFIANSQTAQGTVLQNVAKNTFSKTSQSVNYSPKVQFSTADGKNITFISNTSSSPAEFQVGQTVEVLYNPGNPQNAQINSAVDVFLTPIIFAIVGGALILMGISSAINQAKRKAVGYVENKVGNTVGTTMNSIVMNNILSRFPRPGSIPTPPQTPPSSGKSSSDKTGSSS
jgi:CxxC motif-containing protein (DUF1111 family)